MTYVVIGNPTCGLHMRRSNKYCSGLCKEVRVLTTGVLIRSDRGLRHYISGDDDGITNDYISHRILQYI